jgi:hypothetical protein
MTARYRMPTKLGPKGRSLWKSIAEAPENYTLRADELRLLEDAAREADLIERLEDAQRDEPLTAKGSMGQTVASPFVSELRQHRSALASLLKQLQLPMSPEQAKQTRERNSTAARAAGRARWSKLQAV